jgi:aspartyl-tRNA synthetase
MAQLCHAPSLRDVIAFPKANSGNELMTQAPGELSEEELKFYNLKLLDRPAGDSKK